MNLTSGGSIVLKGTDDPIRGKTMTLDFFDDYEDPGPLTDQMLLDGIRILQRADPRMELSWLERMVPRDRAIYLRLEAEYYRKLEWVRRGRFAEAAMVLVALLLGIWLAA